MKVGDKVLIEGVLSGEPVSSNSWRVKIEGGVAEDPLQGWVNKNVIRPWTEKPVTVLWTSPGNWCVMSDGSVRGKESGACCDKGHAADTLAAYVRHLGAK